MKPTKQLLMRLYLPLLYSVLFVYLGATQHQNSDEGNPGSSCSGLFAGDHAVFCSTTYDSVTVTVKDWKASSPPIPLCKKGLISAITEILGIPPDTPVPDASAFEPISCSLLRSRARRSLTGSTLLPGNEEGSEPIDASHTVSHGHGGESLEHQRQSIEAEVRLYQRKTRDVVTQLQNENDPNKIQSLRLELSTYKARISDLEASLNLLELSVASERVEESKSGHQNILTSLKGGKFNDTNLSGVSKVRSKRSIFGPLWVRLNLAKFNDKTSKAQSAFQGMCYKLPSIPGKFIGLLATPAVQQVLRLAGPLYMDISVDDEQSKAPANTVNVFSLACQALELANKDPLLGKGLQCLIVNLFSALLTCSHPRNVTFPHTRDATSVKGPSPLQPYCVGDEDEEKIYTSEPVPIRLVPLNVSKVNPLPRDLPKSLIDRERSAHYFLFRATQETLDFVTLPYPKYNVTPVAVRDLVPGWKTERIVFLKEEGQVERSSSSSVVPDDRVSYLFIARPRQQMKEHNKCDVLMVFRPTLTMFEWKLDLLTNMIPFMQPPHMEAAAHAGLVSVALPLIGPVSAYITSVLTECPKVKLYLTGHSLGGGVGQIAALKLREIFSSDQVLISAAFYGALNVFNEYAATIYAQSINGRTMEYIWDSVPSSPCSVETLPSGMPRCMPTEKRPVLVPTGTGKDFYFKTPGRYMVGAVHYCGSSFLLVLKTLFLCLGAPQHRA